MSVPFPILDTILRNEATFKGDDFLVRLLDTSDCLYELTNGKARRKRANKFFK